MASANPTSSFPDSRFVNDPLPSATATFNKEQLKSKFNLAILDDLDRKKEVKYTVVANGITKSHAAVWWSKFGFTKEIVSGETHSISNFVSCQHCFATYRYGASSTESISHHQCHAATSSCAFTFNKSHCTLDAYFNKNKKQFRVSEQQNLTKLFSIWISDSFRPISIIDDSGLREICSYFYDLGTKNADRHMDVQSLFQSKQTVSRCIIDQAHYYRVQLTELIKEPIENKSLTISPDMWCDRYRQISYLGLTVTYVDSNMKYHKFTMSCRDFPVDLSKSGENISKILKEELNRFGIDHFDSVNWISDRGSNFIRCFNLNMVIPIHCFAHRLHNVLTVTFINEKIDGYFNDEDIDDIPDKLGQDEFLGNEFITMAAKKILLTISYTKTLVRFVKKTNLNELIVKLGGDDTKTLKQSVTTRWLSLFICVESVYSNYDATLLALESRRTTKYMNDLRKNSLIDLLLLLAPINAALQAIQTDETPSLHLLHQQKKYSKIFQNSCVAEYLLAEPSGVQFFREHIHLELNKIIFDARHYMSMCLHPALHEMNELPEHTKMNCHENIRKLLQEEEAQLSVLDQTTRNDALAMRKQRKMLNQFLDEEDDDEKECTPSSSHQDELDIDQDDSDVYHKSSIRRSSSESSLSTEFSYKTNYQAFKPDELDRYLESDLSSTIVKANPLEF
ncbi:unnamed protein product [Rotaria sp. Silwood2]|nr:unnamed protein product [Rotaria sp. Silwood2]